MLIKVLIVDDEDALPRIMRDYLEDEGGFDVTIASSGEAGLELCQSARFDVCIVDVRLGKMTGNEFIVMAHQQLPECQFIIHTGSLDYVIPEELTMIGLTSASVLFKPILDLAEIEKKINSLLGL